jgi:hypothetical protein
MRKTGAGHWDIRIFGYSDIRELGDGVPGIDRSADGGAAV